MARNNDQLQSHYFGELAALVCGDGGHYLARFGPEITFDRMKVFVREYQKMQYTIEKGGE